MIWLAVEGSGGYLRTSAIHDSVMSSMAAYSAPFGRTRASAKDSSGTRRATLPSPPTPRASASLRAGSTVSTSTRPPRRWAAMAPSAAEIVVLPTPPGSADDYDLLRRQELVQVSGLVLSH